ncbi:MAG: 16S rRNA (uracil(1498)-N(3))-methyltransferase [Melioribacteraceae bacterium]|nr:16S rRNA (uracil(1498)-N(3))-methyltransferase [Melioribacteraceae bacterium]MCF8264446.1 16S rRNA (uracil(1498)-N(3))-methyltransferase [Melioribacteraceae bacterium]MCF8414190.1 16S rRNA (uracil(1498)-N(3))-methyltransferase [Melioribacteraceae bacterium]
MLSNIELYYTLPTNFDGKLIRLEGLEFKHAAKVMRHSEGDLIHITDGKGKIFSANISSINQNELVCEKLEVFEYERILENITIAIPRLKSPDRFDFALEKCVELGFTKFVVFESERTIAKGEKTVRWNKIALSAMKQSLRAFVPNVIYTNKINNIVSDYDNVIVFEQNSINRINDDKFSESITQENTLLIFGPEGGLSEAELEQFSESNIYSISDFRLRSESAIVSVASFISLSTKC